MADRPDLAVARPPAAERDVVDLGTADLYAGPARSASEVDAARLLHTRRYIELGAVPPAGDGPFDDGWMDRREWLVVADGRNVVGACSLIAPTHTLPTLDVFGIDPSGDPRIAGAWRRCRIVEVSTLVRDPRFGPGVLIRALLYRVIWMSHARRKDHDMWLMSMSVERMGRLGSLFPLPFELLSGVHQHYNHDSVACALDLRLARSALRMRAAPLLRWVDGQSDDFELVTAGATSNWRVS
jgi:hypothetical protein